MHNAAVLVGLCKEFPLAQSSFPLCWMLRTFPALYVLDGIVKLMLLRYFPTLAAVA